MESARSASPVAVASLVIIVMSSLPFLMPHLTAAVSVVFHAVLAEHV
jgi:hypothetical protein